MDERIRLCGEVALDDNVLGQLLNEVVCSRTFDDVSPTMAPPPIRTPEVVMHHGVIILTQRHGEHGGQGVDQLNVISGAFVAASVRMHQKPGPGLLESVYEVVLARDLVRLGLRVERQKAVSFEFEGTLFVDAFRPDLIINQAVIVEVKAARAPDPVFERQLLTCLKS